MKGDKHIINKITYIGGAYNPDEVIRQYAKKEYKPLESTMSYRYFSLGKHLLQNLTSVISDAVQELDIECSIDEFLRKLYN